MPRKPYQPSSNEAYHISARCRNREWFKIPMHRVWDLYSEYLYFLHHAFKFRIHNFVLMNNHYHMIVSTPEANAAAGMNYFQRETSKCIGKMSGRINQTYGGPYHWSLLTSYRYNLYAYKYVYRNPVDAGICSDVLAYPYSTLHSLTGQSHALIPTLEDEELFTNTKNHLEWLNKSYPSEELRNEIKKALRYKVFHFPKQKSREPHALDLIML